MFKIICSDERGYLFILFYLELYSTSSILQFTSARPINKINSSFKH